MLTAEDLLDIVTFWRAHKPTMNYLAAQFNISSVLAQRIIMKYKRDPSMLARKCCKEEIKKEKISAVSRTVQDLVDGKKNIWSLEHLQTKVNDSYEVMVPRPLIARVLKYQFDMSYRKVKHAAHLANIDRSLVLRQKYAMIMLPLLLSDKRIINIDESSVPFLDFRKSKWAPKGVKNSISVKDLSAKVNIILAVDTQG